MTVGVVGFELEMAALSSGEPGPPTPAGGSVYAVVNAAQVAATRRACPVGACEGNVIALGFDIEIVFERQTERILQGEVELAVADKVFEARLAARKELRHGWPAETAPESPENPGSRLLVLSRGGETVLAWACVICGAGAFGGPTCGSSGATEGRRIPFAAPAGIVGSGGTERWLGTGLSAGYGRSGGRAGVGEGFCDGVGCCTGGAAVFAAGAAGEGTGTVDARLGPYACGKCADRRQRQRQPVGLHAAGMARKTCAESLG